MSIGGDWIRLQRGVARRLGGVFPLNALRRNDLGWFFEESEHGCGRLLRLGGAPSGRLFEGWVGDPPLVQAESVWQDWGRWFLALADGYVSD